MLQPAAESRAGFARIDEIVNREGLRARKATATPPSIGSAPDSADGQERTCPRGPKCAAAATPYALRTITLHHGTRLVTTAAMASTPYRIVPDFSEADPIMKPGSSTRLTIGKWKVSQNSTKRRTFWAPSASMDPA